MENRKYIKFLIPIFILGFFVISINNVFAYGIETHAYLTNEAVKFYNQKFSDNKINEELVPYLLDGVRQEDDIPRWMNHFYDPVKNRGLTYDPAIDPMINLGTWQKSKDWAQDSYNQNSLTYKVPTTIASVLTAIQQKKISALTTETDFIWERAVKFYAQGEKEKAMLILGHILHLVEDASVPDHTRNDPHPEDSPYENYTAKFILSNPDADLNKRLSNKPPFIFSDLNSYFDGLAKYSNNNFYSKDTIGIQSGYELPQPNTEGLLKKDGDYYYAAKYDEDNNLYYLFVYKNYHNSFISETKSNIVLKIEDEDRVVNDYWSRLSTKSVQYGAGVINLFFQEVEKAKNDPNFTKIEDKSFLTKTIETAKNLFSQVKSTIGNLLGINQSQQPQQISLLDNAIDNANSDETATSSIIETNNSTEIKNEILDYNSLLPIGSDLLYEEGIKKEEIKNQEKQQEEIVINVNEQSNQTSGQTNTIVFRYTGGSGSGNASVNSSGGSSGGSNSNTQNNMQTSAEPLKILITEIQLASASSTHDDFIEIYNPNSAVINLQNYRLVKRTQTGASDTLIKSWTSGDSIPANSYYLWANSDCSDMSVVSNSTTTQTISNNNGIAIRYGANDTGQIIDSVAWGEAENIFIENSVFPTNSADGQSIQRKFQSGDFIDIDNNAQDFEIQTCPSPKTQFRTCLQNNQSPVASFIYTSLNPQVGDLILFNAASSTDIDGQIISYQWNFGDNATSSATTATTTHIYSQAGNYQVDLIVFDNQNASSTATSTTILINSLAPAGVNHIVISEIYPDKTGNNFDFVELYNPTDSSIELGNYSLKRQTGSATSTNSLSSFSSSQIIAAKSFFLVGLSNYGSSTYAIADKLNRSYSLSTSGSETISILLFENDAIIDQANYNPVNFIDGQSLERKAFSTSTVDLMVSGEHRFSGNGYDTDSADDFILRNSAEPQNSQNFPEPRNAPITPQNFSIQYSSSTMELNFNWNVSQDYFGATSTIIYKISDISNSSSTFAEINTTSTAAIISLNENNFGKTYLFSIQAFDKENFNSTSSQKEISIPNSTLIIAQQLDKFVFDQGDGNGHFDQDLGNGLLGSPQSITFHAKLPSSGYWIETYYINATFWQSNESDYSNLIKISSNTCTRDNPGATYANGSIYGSDCPNLNFEFNIDKDYTIPIQQSFTFDPSKYYKLKFEIYQNYSYFYGSNNSSSYIYGKATKYDNNSAYIDAGIKDLYFLIKTGSPQSPIELPASISQSVAQNFEANYSTSTLAFSLNWDKPRYFNASSSAPTYRITDISSLVSSSTLVLPEIITSATSTTIAINEVGRNYKFSIVAIDQSGNESLASFSKEINIPYSLNERFIFAQQIDYINTTQAQYSYYRQFLGNNLSGGINSLSIYMKDIGQQDNHNFYFYECDVNYVNCSSLVNHSFTTSDLTTGINTFSFPRITLAASKWYYFNFVFRGSGQNWKLGYSENDAWINGHFVYWDSDSYVPYNGEKDLYFIITSPISLR